MRSESSRGTSASTEQIPSIFLGDDATSTDQIALAVLEILGKRVMTTDAESLQRSCRSFDRLFVRVINTGTRALSHADADARNQFLARHVLPGEASIPVLQIDSRLRGIGNALRGIYESLDFDLLLFVPAEPELDRLIHNGVFCHVEDGRLIPFHQSRLANPLETPLQISDLRDFVAAEMGVSAELIISINEEVVSKGPDAVANLIRGIARHRKPILIPDVTGTEHFEAVVLAKRKLEGVRVLIAGSRTFLRSYFASSGVCKTGIQPMRSLSQGIDRQKRGAPLAVISSLEPAMNSQIEYAQRALGPNLVTVAFDSSVVLADGQGIRQEIDRAQQLILQSLKAMRPVLLQTSRTRVCTDPAFRQKHLNALSEVVADERIHRHLTSLSSPAARPSKRSNRHWISRLLKSRGRFRRAFPGALRWKDLFRAYPL